MSQKRAYNEADFTVYTQIKHQFEPHQEEHLVLYATNHYLDRFLAETRAYLQTSESNS
ncbi:hypothetical protein AAG747_04935 [Rapidithrix thailandica]|uniref:Uncharacterized protein n=1 Tax=Rapidithrix thailandica TaxID=413964 RepID=A0AAW9S8J6_9BACT